MRNPGLTALTYYDTVLYGTGRNDRTTMQHAINTGKIPACAPPRVRYDKIIVDDLHSFSHSNLAIITSDPKVFM